MGEVYRARDTKLGRDVAIKILTESFAHDAERLARFEREARSLASLNHPNIAQIHGVDESGGITALVLEGPSLADRKHFDRAASRNNDEPRRQGRGTPSARRVGAHVATSPHDRAIAVLIAPRVVSRWPHWNDHGPQ